jgi:hypothetical protein
MDNDELSVLPISVCLNNYFQEILNQRENSIVALNIVMTFFSNMGTNILYELINSDKISIL